MGEKKIIKKKKRGEKKKLYNFILLCSDNNEKFLQTIERKDAFDEWTEDRNKEVWNKLYASGGWNCDRSLLKL